MPIEVENKLKARARKKGFKGKRFDRYVYGTMNKQGLLESIHPRLVELGWLDAAMSGAKAAGVGLLDWVRANPVAGAGAGLGLGLLLKKKQQQQQSVVINNAARLRLQTLAAIHPRLVELAGKIDLGDKPGPPAAKAKMPVKKFSCVPAFLIQFADPRPRNSLGEYTSDPGEGVDPNQMAAAYGPPEVSQSHIERIKRFFGKRRQASQQPENA